MENEQSSGATAVQQDDVDMAVDQTA